MITDEYGLKKRHEELLQLIKEVDYLLKDNDIKYSLSGGTLLGAIRHNGFIPWDDDLDIMLDRFNYEKLIRVFKANNYTLQITDNTTIKEYRLKRILWIYRIQRADEKREGLTGALIDVGVMDKCPDNVLKRKIKVFIIQVLQGMMHETVDLKKHSLLMKICLVVTYTVGRLFSDSFKFGLYDKVSKINNDEETLFISQYNDLFSTLACRFDNDIMESIEEHVFEDTKLPITTKYDNYLRTLYGDYMVPPKEEDRIPIHTKII